MDQKAHKSISSNQNHRSGGMGARVDATRRGKESGLNYRGPKVEAKRRLETYTPGACWKIAVLGG